MTISSTDVHAHQPVLTDGPAPAQARAVVILLHGRGGSAVDVMRLVRNFPREGVGYVAPQAANHEWYPARFLAPLAQNAPHLGSALAVVSGLVAQTENAGVPRERIVLGGFSQGACLALESAARLGGRLGGVLALAGAVIGPPGEARPLDQRLDGTPVLLGCGDLDAHIPLASVEESARVLTALGAHVDLQIYRGVGHIIVSDELERSRALIEQALK